MEGNHECNIGVTTKPAATAGLGEVGDAFLNLNNVFVSILLNAR